MFMTQVNRVLTKTIKPLNSSGVALFASKTADHKLEIPLLGIPGICSCVLAGPGPGCVFIDGWQSPFHKGKTKPLRTGDNVHSC